MYSSLSLENIPNSVSTEPTTGTVWQVCGIAEEGDRRRQEVVKSENENLGHFPGSAAWGGEKLESSRFTEDAFSTGEAPASLLVNGKEP